MGRWKIKGPVEVACRPDVENGSRRAVDRSEASCASSQRGKGDGGMGREKDILLVLEAGWKYV